MKTQVGTCPQCGAPIYVPMVWGGITPPPNKYSCSCRLGNINVSWVSEKTTYQPMNTSQTKYTQEDLDRAVEDERERIVRALNEHGYIANIVDNELHIIDPITKQQ